MSAVTLHVRMEESVWMVSMDSLATVWTNTQDTHVKQVYTVKNYQDKHTAKVYTGYMYTCQTGIHKTHMTYRYVQDTRIHVRQVYIGPTRQTGIYGTQVCMADR